MTVALPASLAGAADTAAFLATRAGTLRHKPGRAAGSAAVLGLWLAAAAMTRSGRSDAAARAVAGALLAANAALLAAHLRARVATPRVFAGAALSAVVLGDTLRR
jgi:hypothetical protein